LPTRKELKTLYQKDAGTHNMTPLLKTIETWVWSDETKGLSSAWSFNFLNGIEDWFFRLTGCCPNPFLLCLKRFLINLRLAPGAFKTRLSGSNS
jgi:hypothetical protein